MDALRKLFKLSHGDRRLLLRALMAVASAWLAVRLLPASVVVEKVSQDIPLGPGQRPQTTDRIAWAISVASRYIPASKCLVHAIAGRSLLAHYGIPSEIRIGVAKDSKNWLSAHAWVEVEGKTLIGGDTTPYAPLTRARQEYRP
jgi:hypothetical protein